MSSNWWDAAPLVEESAGTGQPLQTNDATWWNAAPLVASDPAASSVQRDKPARSWLDAAKDTAVQLAEGVNTIAGAVPNLVAPQSGVAEFFRSNADHWRAEQSPAMLQKVANAEAQIATADQDSIIDQVVTAAKAYSADPALAARFVVTNLPSMIPGIGAAKLAQAARLASGASAAAAAGTATTAAGGVNAVLNAGGARGEAFEDVRGTLLAQGRSKEEAERIALDKSLLPAAVGGATGFLSGKVGLERALVGGSAARGSVGAGLRSAGAEMLGEQAEELAPQVATNYQAGEFDQRPWSRNIGRTAVETAVASGPSALVSGGLTAQGAIAAERARLEAMRATKKQAEQFVGEKRQEAVADIGAQDSVDGAIAAATRAVSLDSSQLLADALGSVGIDLNELQQADAADAAAQAMAQAPSAPSALADPAAPAAEDAPIAPAPANQAVQPGGLEAPVRTWSGRRGDGYAAPEDAERGLKERMRLQPNLDWRVEPTPDGRYRLAGYATAQTQPMPAEPGPAERTAPLDLSVQAMEQGNGQPVLQNRDRTSAASVAQMNDIAARPDYMRAGPSREMQTGAPVVVGDVPATALAGRSETVVDGRGDRVQAQYMVVEASDLLASNRADGTPNQGYAEGAPGMLRAVAGNGRTAGIQAAYERGTAGGYQQELLADAQALGVDAAAMAAMQRPVLVRVMRAQDVRADMGDRTNIASTQDLSAIEQATNDAGRIQIARLQFDENGDPTPESIRAFIHSTPVSERGKMQNPDGSHTRQAIDRLMAATFKQAYASDDLVRLYAQATNPEARAVMAALADASGAMAGMADAGALDIRQAVADAAKMAVNATRRGLKLVDLVQNADLDMSPEAFVVAQFMADNIRSAKRMGDGLRAWAQFAAEQARIARENETQTGIFGDQPTVTREQLFQLVGQQDIAGAAQSARFADAAGRAERQDADGAATAAGPADRGLFAGAQAAAEVGAAQAAHGAADSGQNQGAGRTGAALPATEKIADSEPAEALELTAPTRASLENRQQDQERATKEEAARKRAEDAAAQADDERKHIAQASVAAADSFELGQDPMDSLTGQKDVFADAPAGIDAPSDRERELRSLSREKEQPGDVKLGNAMFVTMDQAKAAALAAIDAGVLNPAMPFQYNAVLDIAPRDWDRMVKAMAEFAGSTSAKDPTRTAAFKRWFGDSAVVDADGKPLVMYHGTSATQNGEAFTLFDTYASNYGLMGAGAYFTDNPAVAGSYTSKGKGSTPTVYPVHLSIKAPLDMDAEADPAIWRKQFPDAESYLEDDTKNENWYRAAEDALSDQGIPKWEGAEVMQAGLRAMGFDGITHIGGGRVKADGVTHRVYIAFDPEQIKSATGNNGAFDPANPDIRYSFAGAAARTADLGELQRAKDMAERRIPSARIQQETGWHQGVDGRWRFEISDDQALLRETTVTPEDSRAVEDEVRERATVTRMDDGVFTATLNDGTEEAVSGFGGSEAAARKSLSARVARQRYGAEFSLERVKDRDLLALPDVLHHPDLFAAYPFLQGLTVHFRKGGSAMERGSYDESRQAVTLNADRTPAEVLSTLLHELQHAIQGREDFARGGSADRAFSDSVKTVLRTMADNEAISVERWKTFNSELLDSADKAAAMARDALKYESMQRLLAYSERDKPSGVFRLIRQEMQWIYSEEYRGNAQALELQRRFYGMPQRGDKRNAYIRAMAFDAQRLLRATIAPAHLAAFKADERTTKGMIAAMRRQADKAQAKLQPLRERESRARVAESLQRQSEFKTAYEVYQSLAGEVEARTTQARQHLTPEQRRSRPVQADMDTPPGAVIVVVGGNEMLVPEVQMDQRAPDADSNANTMSADLARTILALGRPPERATKESVRAAVRELVNGLGLLPNSLGRIVVATSAEIKQDWEPLIGPVTMDAEGAGRAQGFYDPKTKTVFVIADHIRQGDELGVVAHELMHKHGPAVLGKEGWNQLHGAIGGWAKAKAGSMERIVYDEAARRVQASGPELSNQELFPYAVQVALEMGVRPDALAPQGSVARWLAQVRAALRQVWDKITGKPELFKSQDLVNLAFGIAQRENPAHAGELDNALNGEGAAGLAGEKVSFSRESPAASVRADDEGIVADINRAIARSGARVTAVATFDELPQHVKEVAAANGVKPAEMRGITLGGGRVYIVQGNHSSAAEVEATIVHEVYGHVGIRALFGADIYRRLNKLYLSLGESRVRALAEKYGVDASYFEMARDLAAPQVATRRAGGAAELRNGWLTEELLAHIAESEAGTLRQRAREVVGAVRAWLRENGFMRLADLGMTDIAHILKRGRLALETQTDFSGAEDVPAFSRASGGFDLPAETWMLKRRRRMQDYFIRVQEVQKTVLKQGGVLDEQTNTYLAEELSHGRAASLLQDFARDVVEPLMEKAAKLGVELEELSLFAYAMHAPERNAQIASIDPQLQDGGSGMTNADAQAIIDQARQDGKLADLQDLHADLMAITQANRLVMLDEGLITQKEFDALNGAYQNYIPLRGFEVVDEDGKPTGRSAGKGFNIRGPETLRAKGRTSRAGLLIENALADYQRTVVRAERNQVAKVFLNFAMKNPDPDLWEIDALTTRKSIDRTTGRIARTTDIDKGEDTIAVKVNGVEIFIRIKDELLLRAMKKSHSDDTGENERFLLKSVSMYTSLLRNTLTRYNPEFAVVNALRDFGFGSAAMLDELGEKGAAKFVAHYRGAVAVSARNERNKLDPQARDWDKWFTEYRAAGGTTSGFYAKGAEDISKDIRQILLTAGAKPKDWTERLVANKPVRAAQAALRVLEFAGSTSENAARVAAYRTAREMGKTPAQAASIAKNLTTNFDRKGELGQWFNSFYVFFNAAVQGSHRTLKMLANKKVMGYMAGVSAASAAIAMASALVGGDDPDDDMAYWDKIPPYVKERNFIIMLPPGAQMEGVEEVGNKGRYIAIPVQYGLNLFHLLGYQIADVLRNQKDKMRGVSLGKAGINMGSALAGSFNPFGGAVDLTSGSSMAQALLPSLMDPVYQLATGTNGFGREVAPFKSPFDTSPDSDNVNVRQEGGAAHRVAQWINAATGGDEYESGAIDVSPGTLENVVRNLTGGTGAFIYDVLNLAGKGIEQAMGGDPDVFVRDIPFGRKLYGETAGDVDQGLFYERRKAIEEARGIQKRRDDAGLDMNDSEKEAQAGLSKDASKYTKWLSGNRKEMVEVKKDAEMSDLEKRVRLRELRAERDTLTSEFNKAWIETMKEWAAEEAGPFPFE